MEYHTLQLRIQHFKCLHNADLLRQPLLFGVKQRTMRGKHRGKIKQEQPGHLRKPGDTLPPALLYGGFALLPALAIKCFFQTNAG